MLLDDERHVIKWLSAPGVSLMIRKLMNGTLYI